MPRVPVHEWSDCVPVVPVALLFGSMGSAQVGKEGVLLDPPHVDT